MKAATLKDVLYALEFTGAQLCHFPTYGSGKALAWSLEPGGVKAPPHVADKARQSPCIIASGESKYGETRYIWQRQAA